MYSSIDTYKNSYKYVNKKLIEYYWLKGNFKKFQNSSNANNVLNVNNNGNVKNNNAYNGNAVLCRPFTF